MIKQFYLTHRQDPNNLCQSGSESNDNKRVLQHSLRVIRCCLMSYPGHLLGWGLLLCSSVIGIFYSPSLQSWRWMDCPFHCSSNTIDIKFYVMINKIPSLSMRNWMLFLLLRGKTYQPIGLVGRVFPNGPGDRVSISGWVISKTQKKWYLMLPCLTPSTIRYVSRVKWSNHGKGVAPSPTYNI